MFESSLTDMKFETSSYLPERILYNFIISPLDLVEANVVIFSLFRCSIYDSVDRPGVCLVDCLYIFNSFNVVFEMRAPCLAYSRCGLISDIHSSLIVPQSLYSIV